MGGIIIPSETDLNPEGFLIRQVIMPKKGHVTKWSLGVLRAFSRFDFSIGPILNLVDLVTGYRYQELPAHVDFLVGVEMPSNTKILKIHQLVTPCLQSKKSPEWIIGRVKGFMDGVEGAFNSCLVTDIQSDKMHKVNIRDIDLLIRRESSFSLEV